MTSEKPSHLKERVVLFDHDGNADDIIALIVVLRTKNIKLIGVTVAPADCFVKEGVELTIKSICFTDQKIPVAGGTIEKSNPFPDDYRVISVKSNNLPMFLHQKVDKSLHDPRPAHEFIVDKIKNSEEKVTVVMTGPATNLVAALQLDPSIQNNIEEVIWMAGAVDVPGNLKKMDHIGVAEWNVFWDPHSSKYLFETGLNILIVPLDATNLVPIDYNFLKILAEQREKYDMIDLAGQLFALAHDTSPNILDAYCAWDTLTVAYLGCKDLFTIRQEKLEVLVEKPFEGQTIKSDKPCARLINIADKVNLQNFYEFLIEMFSFNAKINVE